MKTSLMFLVVLCLAGSVSAQNRQFDYSRPFPLSLLEYSPNHGNLIPQLFDVDNIKVNHDNTAFLQNEVMVAINPQNTDNAVALYRDFRLGYRRIGVAYTFDAGQSWHDTLLFVPPYPWQSDPVLGVDTLGNFFACSLCLNSTGQGPDGIYLQKSTDGGISWSDPVVCVDSASAYFEDKQMMAINNYPNSTYGNIYIAWTRFNADLTASSIYAISSDDHGESFSVPVRVSDAGGVQWPVAAVSPDGNVHVAWFRYFPAGIYSDVSYDGGHTFNTDSLVVGVSASAEEINGGILVFPYPAFVIDNTSGSPMLGNMYIAYMDDFGTDKDIYFVRSLNNGINWSDPIRINDDDLGNGADQFHPWLAIDELGVIHAIFYDRRLDPDNLLFDLYYTKSSDGGTTWSPNERITSVSSDPSQAALAGLIGEYIGISAWQGQVQMAWTDTRNGNQDIYSGRMDQTGITEIDPILPREKTIVSVYPNPFNSSLMIEYKSNGTKPVNFEIFDILGQKINTLSSGLGQPGINRIIWDGKDNRGNAAAGGIYIIRDDSPTGDTKKAILLR